MEWKKAKILALQEVKITHKDFSSNEWLIMRGNKIIFEDGVQIFEKDWMEDKPFLQDGWFEFE